MKNSIYSVSQVNNYLKLVLKDDVLLNKISIIGEVSNFKLYSSGNLFFSLKDQDSIINCIMYNSNTSNLNFELYNGIEVICFGYISLYEKTGQYQLCIISIEISGKGNFYLQFEQLKEKLNKLDLFNSKFKKLIPKNPSSITIITSLDGAVLHDILKVSSRRNPSVKIIIHPILVQGEQAKESIITAIKNVNKWAKTDTIILARGGGSIEDLSPFNEEEVALAIFDSKIPIISAIGHEVDFTISDFVSDLRAPTPSAAAEIAIPEVFNIKAQITQIYLKILSSMKQKLIKSEFNLNFNLNFTGFKNFKNKLGLYKYNIKTINKNINSHFRSKFKQNKLILQSNIENIENKSPINILKKGYSIIYDKDKQIIKNKQNLKKGDILNINFYDGEIKAKVIEQKDN